MGRRVVILLAVVAVVAVITFGGTMWYRYLTQVSTDDAYVEGTISPVSAKVPGHVTELFVRDNQTVKKGDVLLRVDARDYEARRDQLRAAVAVAEAGVRAARWRFRTLARDVTRAQVDEGRAALESTIVGVKSSESAVEEARARLEARRAATAAMRADVNAAQSNERRARASSSARGGLVKTTSCPVASWTRRRRAQTAAAVLDATQRRLAQTEGDIQQAEAELASRILGIEQSRQKVAESRGALARAQGQSHQVAVKDAEVVRAEARLKEAQADLAVAELALEHTVVRAPLDGVVSKRAVEVGQIVQLGQPLLAIVPLHDVWVVANFKETQFTRVRPGMQATVPIDSFPDKTFTGTVHSLSAGTGSRFSLLPPRTPRATG